MNNGRGRKSSHGQHFPCHGNIRKKYALLRTLEDPSCGDKVHRAPGPVARRDIGKVRTHLPQLSSTLVPVMGRVRAPGLAPVVPVAGIWLFKGRDGDLGALFRRPVAAALHPHIVRPRGKAGDFSVRSVCRSGSHTRQPSGGGGGGCALPFPPCVSPSPLFF